MRLSILIPVYNEVNTVLPLMKQVINVNLNKEIILVDDLSNDGTRELLKDKFIEGQDDIKVFYHKKNMGKGVAIQTALRYASGDYSIIQDADLEYDPQDYLKLIECAEKNNADVVYGSRFYKSWRTTSLFHYLVNKFLSILTNILFKTHLTDMETCYKLIKTDLFKKLDLKSKRFEIEPEITAKLLKKGYKIYEVPISYRGRSYHEGKKIGWRDGVVSVWTLIRLRFS